MIALLLLACLSLLNAADAVATDVVASDNANENTAEVFYRPDEVSEGGAALQKELSDINASLKPSTERVEIEAALPAYIEALKALRVELEKEDISGFSIKRLSRMIEQARVYIDQLAQYERTLQKSVDANSAVLVRLKNLEKVWTKTVQNAVSENAPEAIIARINKSLIRITDVRTYAKSLYDDLLTYTDMVVSEGQKMSATLERLEKTRSTLEVRLLVRDSDPLVSAVQTSDFDVRGLSVALVKTLRDIRHTNSAFYGNNADNFYAHMLATAVIFAVMIMLYRKDKKGKLFLIRDEKVRGSLLFVRSPVAATVILSLMLVAAFYSERPAAVKYGVVLVALSALLLMIHRIADAAMFRNALWLSGVFVVGGLLNQTIGYTVEIRLLWFIITIIMLIKLYDIFRPGGILSQYSLGKWMHFVTRLGPLAILLMGVSLIANLFGYYHLAHKLAHATLISLIIFMAFSVVGMVVNGLIVMFVRRRSLESKHLLEAYARQIENNLKFLSNSFLVLYWLYLVLKQFEISYFVAKHYEEIMALSWQIGDATLSLRSLLDFVLVLVITSFLTRFTRIVLDLEIFSRYHLPRGVPTAIQMMIRYLIITVGILLALSVLGIEMSDLSLIAGALGVGIGFGLRNIMANFVSGLLMIFERPVQLGDVIEVGQIFGDVQRIGVRATTIKTYDGSEVIVPNADFITKEVTNWTLSSKLRRVKMAYKVAFGNEPRHVIDIMRGVIESHPDIQADPAPKVLFEGYGDYFLEFTVYFWVEERLLDVKSETAIGIFEALSGAGIAMPVPHSHVKFEGASPTG